MKKHLDLVLLAPLCMALGYWQLQYDGYVKDDAFIAMRYARNLAEGYGMVFNYGDKLEGYTDFLWVLMLTPAQFFGWDMLQWAKWMGCFFGQLGIIVTYLLAKHFVSGRRDAFNFVGAALWSVSTSVILWSQGGLEPTLMAVLCAGGSLLGMMALAADPAGASTKRLVIGSSVLLGLACYGRPDAHVVPIVAAAFVGWDAWKRPAMRRLWGLWLAIGLAMLVPYHLWRIWYFGDLFPNTFYVKAATGSEVYAQGKTFALELMGFNVNPAVFGLIPFAFLGRERRVQKLWALALVVVFLLYMVKVGRDEMKYFRLYLPVYPLALALAADGMRQLLGLLAKGLGKVSVPEKAAHGLVTAIAVVATSAGVIFCWQFNESKQRWNDQFVGWSEKSFQKMGKYIADRSETGDVVVFQDMGAAPWAAPDQKWVDTIGILDHTVAHSLAEIGLNPFMRGIKRREPGGAEEIEVLDEFLRDYFFEQEPEWIAFVAYVSKSRRKAFSKNMRKASKSDDRKDKEHKMVKRYLRDNPHGHGMYKDRRFHEDFEYERYFKRNQGYWLVLFKRK